MSQLSIFDSGETAYTGPRKSAARQRTVAVTVAIAVHGLAIGMLAFQQKQAVLPPEPILEVSLVPAFSMPSVVPTPAAPPPPPPLEARVMETPPIQDSPVVAPPPVVAEPARLVTVASTVSTASSAVAATAVGPPSPSADPGPPAVTPPNFTAAYLNNPGPQYPMASRRKREQGVVRLRVLVSDEGATQQVLLDRSSGHADLDAAALDVVKKRWRFAPAKQGDRAVSAWVLVPIAFELKG